MIASSRCRAAHVALASLLVGAASLVITTPAMAGDPAGAEVLFTEGKRLVGEGNYAAACPKFEESQKLDPGMGTLYRLGDCYEHIGRTASAWAAFVEVAGSAKTSGQQARAEDAKKRAADLEPNLAKLVIHVATPNLPGLVVKRGDVVVGQAQWNTPMPVDPGEVSLEAAAPGYKTWHGSASVAARATIEANVPGLEQEPVQPVTPPSGTSADNNNARAQVEPRSSGSQRTLAVVAGAAGLIGLGVGSIFGLSSISKGSDADGHCDARNTCDAKGVNLRHDAIKAGNIATIGFIAGGVLATAGVVLWVTAPSATSTSAAGVRSPRGPRMSVATRGAGLAFQMEVP